MQRTLKELADFLDCRMAGDPEHVVTQVATLEQADRHGITFLNNRRYKLFLKTTQAGIVILDESCLSDCPTNALVVADPYLAYAKVAELFDKRVRPQAGVHPSVVMGRDCVIDPSASIGPYTVLGDDVQIDGDVSIGPQCSIGSGSRIGAGTRLFARVTLYENVQIGQRCMIHSGAVIGSEGFGLANESGKWRRVPQLGLVVLGDDVDVGANTTIDCGTIENTTIANGVKLDNQVQVGHNVQIGEHTAIAGCVGIAGSAKIGKHCGIGGGAGINGHIEIGDQVIISGMSGVRNSIKAPGLYSSSMSAMPDHLWRKNFARLKKLDELTRLIKQIEKQLLAWQNQT